jgi:hypothetical protein
MEQLALFAPVICGMLNLTAAGISLTAAALSRRCACRKTNLSWSSGMLVFVEDSCGCQKWCHFMRPASTQSQPAESITP